MTGTTEFLALINLHRFLQTIEMKFTFGDSKKFANVHIFEAIKEEPDARVVEISGMVSWEKPSLFKGKSRFLL